MKTITFVTVNKFKYEGAVDSLKPFGIIVEQAVFEIDEIQSDNVYHVALDKAKKAFAVLNKPLIVTDAGWSIPALNGFPGAYMKDMNQWFTPEDFLNLMSEKEDKRVILKEYAVYIDEAGFEVFEQVYEGRFIDEIKGNSGKPVDKVVTFTSDGLTVAEIGDTGSRALMGSEIVWEKFAEWYLLK
jgi:non-canonical purine NTP pyrophosphatase (RdgB/HAM1 family)